MSSQRNAAVLGLLLLTPVVTAQTEGPDLRELAASVKAAFDESRWSDILDMTAGLGAPPEPPSEDSLRRSTIAYAMWARSTAYRHLGDVASATRSCELSLEWTKSYEAAVTLLHHMRARGHYERVVAACDEWSQPRHTSALVATWEGWRDLGLHPAEAEPPVDTWLAYFSTTGQQARADIMGEQVKTLVRRGDRRYEAGDLEAARCHYVEALTAWEAMPGTDYSRELWESVCGNNIAKGNNHSLTLDYRPADYVKTRLLLEHPTFLREKLDVVNYEMQQRTRRSPQMIHRVACILVRKVDVTWEAPAGEEVHTVTRLSDSEVERKSQAWEWATRAIEVYSGDRVSIESEYFDFPDMVLTGIKSSLRGESDWIRRLDPHALVPKKHEFFANAARRFDTFVFFWDGGTMASHHTGDVFSVPGTDPPVRRGLLSRAADDPWTNFHEMLHIIDCCFDAPPCHGFLEPEWPKPLGYTGTCSSDYHRWVFRRHLNVQGWHGFSFVDPPPEKPIGPTVTVERPGTVVRATNVDTRYAQSFASLMAEAREALERAYGLELPLPVELNLACGPMVERPSMDQQRPLISDGVSCILLSIGSELRLRSPPRGGSLNVYCTFRELTRMALNRGVCLRTGMAEGVEDGLIQYMGRSLVDDTARRLVEHVLPNPYDVSSYEGLAPLTATVAVGDWEDLSPSLRAAKVFCEAERRHGRNAVAETLTEALRDRPLGLEVMPRFVKALGRTTGDVSAGQWVPKQLLEPPEVQWAAPRRVSDAAFSDARAAADDTGLELAYGDAEPDGAETWDGPAIIFRRPEGRWAVDCVSVFGYRSIKAGAATGTFVLSVCDEDLMPVSASVHSYSIFPTGEARWVRLPIGPIEVPERFYVCPGVNSPPVVDICYDNDVAQSHSRLAWPHSRILPLPNQFDWMIRAHLVQLGDDR